MGDVVNPEKRSQMMSGIRSKNTMPELSIRSGLHRIGFRFRVHQRKLPGNPDMVFRKYNAVIFVHGCFWHKHSCHLFKWPKTRDKFWKTKLTRNEQVDSVNIARLRGLGWRIGIVWECAVKGRARMQSDKLVRICNKWLMSNRKYLEVKGRQ